LHSDGLVTSDVHSRKPVARIAEKVPTIDDGSIVVLPDGRTQATYKLRTGVTWHDGAPLTSADLVFTYRLLADEGLAVGGTGLRAIREMESVEARDPLTVVFTFKGAYYETDIMSLKMFWPHPRHNLEAPYEKYLQTQDAPEFINLPYTTSAYVHLGPFRLVSLEPERITFEAYDGYFLGRPRIDTIHVQPFNDQNTLYASLLSGTPDMVMSQSLSSELAEQLKTSWESRKTGTVHSAPGYLRMMALQWDRGLQREPTTIQEPRIRAALLHALDREEMASALLAGRRELVAYSLLPANARNYPAVKDGLGIYRYDPARSRALFEATGWTRTADGALRHASDGRQFRTAVWSLPGQEQEGSTIADFWRRAGIDAEEVALTGAQSRDRDYRNAFPGWELTANQGERAIIAKLEVGTSGRGYVDPRGQALVDTFVRSVSPEAQLENMAAIGHFFATELPVLPLYHLLDYLGVRTGVDALTDDDGGTGSGENYGTYSRNAYLWDVR
jgi:peptide/nickel transport system substrate-binding protein